MSTHRSRQTTSTNPTPPALPLATKPHPLDVALAALSEAAADLLAGSRPSRFAELQMLTSIAISIQRLRPGVGVDDVLQEDDYAVNGAVQMVGPPVVMPNRRRHNVMPYNDVADINREIIMIAQKFVDKYLETEQFKAKRPSVESRIDLVTELSELMGLRLRLMADSQPVHESITARIDYLLKRIGEPPQDTEERAHEPAPPAPIE